jgi:hypothetical protein
VAACLPAFVGFYQGAPKKNPKKNKGESVGCFCVGLRFLLGLRRSSSCGRDCADGAVGTQTRGSGLALVIPVLLQLKNPLGEQELRHRSHFGQGERLCEFW